MVQLVHQPLILNILLYYFYFLNLISTAPLFWKIKSVRHLDYQFAEKLTSKVTSFTMSLSPAGTARESFFIRRQTHTGIFIHQLQGFCLFVKWKNSKDRKEQNRMTMAMPSLCLVGGSKWGRRCVPVSYNLLKRNALIVGA